VNSRMRTREWSGVDYYDELGITPQASRAAVDEAFRRRAKTLHPDRNPEATAEERFKRLTVAYEVLRDPVSRQAYDDFRTRVASGTLYSGSTAYGPGGAGTARRSAAGAPESGARRPRRARRQLPNGVRVGLGWALILGAVFAGLWAVVGDLPSQTAGDTTLAVQITLGIVALKLLACGVVVIKYPQLRARWHVPPEAPGRVQRPSGDPTPVASLRNMT
jgi:hypothetical protein